MLNSVIVKYPGANEMAQRVNARAVLAWGPRFALWNPCKVRRRELTDAT